VRRAEMRLSGWSIREALKETRWIWLKNPTNLTQKQRTRYARMEHQNLATAKAYQMRLTLQDIYKIPSQGRAQRKLMAWSRWVYRVARKHPSILFREMVKCAKMIENHLSGIIAHWHHRTTNAFLEGLNSVFS